jgi:uncharacterized membrane protein YdjX (TVP38/TMEM64 family)
MIPAISPAVRSLRQPALMLSGLVAAGAVIHALPSGASGLLDHAASQGGAGMALFIVLGAALCAAGVPRQVVAYAGGFAFGLWGGTALALAATLLGCVVDFAWARTLARDWAQSVLQRRLGERGRTLNRILDATPFWTTLMLRLLPVGNNLALNLLAGLSSVPARPFLVASLLGYVPQTVIFALLGSGARIEQSAQIGLGVALFASSALIGLVLMRKLRPHLAAN